jgi:hypothetical protein
MVAFGDSAANPPEVNYWTLMAGDHGASATAAAAGHQALADTLTTTMGLTEGKRRLDEARPIVGLLGDRPTVRLPPCRAAPLTSGPGLAGRQHGKR